MESGHSAGAGSGSHLHWGNCFDACSRQELLFQLPGTIFTTPCAPAMLTSFADMPLDRAISHLVCLGTVSSSAHIDSGYPQGIKLFSELSFGTSPLPQTRRMVPSPWEPLFAFLVSSLFVLQEHRFSGKEVKWILEGRHLWQDKSSSTPVSLKDFLLHVILAWLTTKPALGGKKTTHVHQPVRKTSTGMTAINKDFPVEVVLH